MEALYSGLSASHCLSSVRAFQHCYEDLVWGYTDVNVSVPMTAHAALEPRECNCACGCACSPEAHSSRLQLLTSLKSLQF